jgi:very-short-patch-repair endonuclease
MCEEIRKCIKCNSELIRNKKEQTNVFKFRKYCSFFCYKGTSLIGKKTGIDKKCGFCAKDIYVKKSMIKEVNFCNSECHNLYQGRNKVSYNCKICSKEFKVSPINAKRRKPTYCSIVCRNLCADWKFNCVITNNVNLQNNKAPTKLEVEGYKILDEIGYPYEKQYPIENKFTVDSFLTDFKLVIQFDGDYWHGLKKDKNGDLDKRQKKRVALDKSQDGYMKKLSYNILRFWEHEIHNDRINVMKRILNEINKQ